MTEASGLANDPAGTASTTRSAGEVERDSEPLRSPSQQAAVLLSEQLRRVAMKAPLQSLVVAFLLGMWVARRRW